MGKGDQAQYIVLIVAIAMCLGLILLTISSVKIPGNLLGMEELLNNANGFGFEAYGVS